MKQLLQATTAIGYIVGTYGKVYNYFCNLQKFLN